MVKIIYIQGLLPNVVGHYIGYQCRALYLTTLQIVFYRALYIKHAVFGSLCCYLLVLGQFKEHTLPVERRCS